MWTAIFSPKLGLNLRASSLLCLSLGGAYALAEEMPEFEKGFGESTGLSKSDLGEAEQDRLKLGGTLWNEFQYFHFGSTSPVDPIFTAPNTLWLYMDARLRNDVRGVVKLKTIYDPTADGSTINVFSGATQQETQVDLEEIKLLFSASKSVFFTVGKQKTKWGSGKFWNPTDFLNIEQRNFFYTTDLRSGIPQIKTHIPVGASNFYIVNGLENANKLSKIRNSARAEVAFGSTEVALTASHRSGVAPSFGADISSAVGDLDAYAEFAYSSGNEMTFYDASGATTNTDRDRIEGVLGLSYDANVFDNDTMSFGLEYFYNGLGYINDTLYPYVISAGAYEAFRLSRHYGMFMIYLPKPGSWDGVTFTLFNVLNLSDKTAVTRLDTLFQLLTDLTLNIAFGVHYGNGNGEFKYGGQVFDTSMRLMIDF